jgi:hypothetical protein
MPTSPVPGERYIHMRTKSAVRAEAVQTLIEIAASAAEGRDGEAADAIEECKWRKRAT